MWNNALAVFDWTIENGIELNVRLRSRFSAAIYGSPISYIQQAKNLGLSMISTLNWQPQITSITNNVNAPLNSINFHHRFLNALVWKQLIQSLALPHFDYISITLMKLDKTRALALQIAHNTCVRFIFGNIRRIHTTNIPTHLTHWRLHLGWLSVTDRHRLKLATLVYLPWIIPIQYVLSTMSIFTQNVQSSLKITVHLVQKYPNRICTVDHPYPLCAVNHSYLLFVVNHLYQLYTMNNLYLLCIVKYICMICSVSHSYLLFTVNHPYLLCILGGINFWPTYSSKNKNSQSLLRFAWFMMLKDHWPHHHEPCKSKESLRNFDFETRQKSRINVLALYHEASLLIRYYKPFLSTIFHAHLFLLFIVNHLYIICSVISTTIPIYYALVTNMYRPPSLSTIKHEPSLPTMYHGPSLNIINHKPFLSTMNHESSISTICHQPSLSTIYHP